MDGEFSGWEKWLNESGEVGALEPLLAGNALFQQEGKKMPSPLLYITMTMKVHTVGH